VKTGKWAALLLALLAVLTVFSVFLLRPGQGAVQAEIFSGGKRIKTVSLSVPQEFTVTGPEGGTNTVTVRDGAIAVTEASCPDHHCVKRGFCAGGPEIVCLPNTLVIRFVGDQTVDAVAGQ